MGDDQLSHDQRKECSRWAPLFMGFSREEYWKGLPFLSPGDLPSLGIEPVSPASPALAGWFFTTTATWEALPKHTASVPLTVSSRTGSAHHISTHFWGSNSFCQSIFLFSFLPHPSTTHWPPQETWDTESTYFAWLLPYNVITGHLI